MTVQLSPSLAFCVAADGPVFLDLRRDRYFRLGSALSAAFLDLMDGRDPTDIGREAITRLSNLEILAPSGTGAPIQPCSPCAPTLRLTAPRVRARARDIGWILLARLQIDRSLRRGGMVRLLAAQGISDRTPPPTLEIAVARFVAARRLVPFAPNCLRDSWALQEFLGRLGLASTLVLGVEVSPFVAHAWVQSGNMVLNDDLDRVAAFTPIFTR